LFAKSLKGVDFAGLLSSVGSGSASAAPATAATTQGKTEDKKVEEPKKVEEEEDVLAGGIGFGDDEEW
jgi:ribosomal protein L12E/L44/L45/RPP1/RPP2